MIRSKLSLFGLSMCSPRRLLLSALVLSTAAPSLAQAQRWFPRRARGSQDNVWRTARIPKFQRIATFEVSQKERKFEDGVEIAPDRIEDKTVAEIVAANEDGTTLVYTDGKQNQLGFIDIEDPENPGPDGVYQLDGEPTSVSIVKGYAVAGVNTSESYTNPSGYLAIIDMDTRTEVHRIDLGGQPDSVAISPDGSFIAVAIENERDEDLNDGVIPQLPAGDLKIIQIDDNMPADWQSRSVDLRNLAEVAPTDPEPEYVDINGRGEIVVTLQENNHLVVVDTENNDAIRHFSAGSVALDKVDTEKDKNIDPSGSLPARPREPDAVTWMGDYNFATANEGDYEGGTRGFSVFQKSGLVNYDSGNSFEHLAISIGHFPDKRAGKKGSEPEGIEYGRYNGKGLLFVGSERGNFVSVYHPTRYGQRMQLVQVLPTGGVGPEGLLAIPQRGLFVVANEKDDLDEGFRATVSIFKQGRRSLARAEYPEIASRKVNGKPIGWSALSGLAADTYNPRNWRSMWAVADSALQPSSIFRINPNTYPATITERIILTENGEPLKVDPEGIARRANGGFWIAAEGKKYEEGKERAFFNELIRVTDRGEVVRRVRLPEALQQENEKFGLEGVAVSYDWRGREVLTAVIQRPWNDAAGSVEGHTRIARYLPSQDEWTFYSYPLDTTEKGWVGLSEITHLYGNRFAVIERDNQQGMDAKIKRVYRIELPSRGNAYPQEPKAIAPKVLMRDLLPELEARNGWTPDKIEGMAVDFFGRFTFVGDNDGLDDAVGETPFWTTYLDNYYW